MSSWMVGVDTGGTFTDLIAFEVDSGELRVAKVPSDPADPSNAVMAALQELFANGIEPADVASLVHGTTVATNAILEDKGVKTGLLITDGFRAVYEARGWARPEATDLIDPFYRKPPLLAPQALTHGIPGRMDYQGNELVPLDEDAVRAAAKRLKEDGVESVAVSYLFSFQNADHERRTAEILEEESTDWRVSLSSVVLPTIREYPRQSTTVIDAYVGPIMQRYLERLSDRLKEEGVETPQVFLMQSNGGLMRITLGARFPNQTLLSGPAGGVVAGEELARITGSGEIVTLDMGGTSTDIAMISDGRADETNEGKIAGQDIGTPMLQVRTLGAGGGAARTRERGDRHRLCERTERQAHRPVRADGHVAGRHRRARRDADDHGDVPFHAVDAGGNRRDRISYPHQKIRYLGGQRRRRSDAGRNRFRPGIRDAVRRDPDGAHRQPRTARLGRRWRGRTASLRHVDQSRRP